MKRNIITLILAVFAMTQTMAQTYDNLWKQAAELEKKDLPKSEMTLMQKIINKATVSKDYGQLLAATFRQVVINGNISQDSIQPTLERIESKANQATAPVQKAVMYAALGKVYLNNDCYPFFMDLKKASAKGNEFFQKALANPALLASQKSVNYEPLVLQGVDGSSFNHDLLHVIGFEANTKKAYELMREYYLKNGNRAAACLCDFEITQLNRRADTKLIHKSKYLNTIDSLIHVYQDLPEAGELAVEHFRFMEGATDATVLDRITYINYALSKWGGWSRMNVLRNALKRYTEPTFKTKSFPKVILPNKKQWLVFDEIRNLPSVTMTISRLNITADNHYDVYDKKDYKTLLSKSSELQQVGRTKSFRGHPDYEIVKDSFEVAGLPVGAYLMEVTTGNASVEPQRSLFYVSDLAVMSQQLPNNKNRYVVVSATDGQPIPGAKLLFYEENGEKGKRKTLATLTTDENGEVIAKDVQGNLLVTTQEDKFLPAPYYYVGRNRYYEQKQTNHNISIFTDRAIYRPSQTVHVTAICFTNSKGIETKAEAHKKVKFVLKDANYKTLAEKETVTDDYGTASTDFDLPSSGLTGRYMILANNRITNIRVEEYKRPTFEISFPKVNARYTWGDTVVVKGTAKTYAGVPVQGAKVSYKVTRRSSLWWWYSRIPSKEVFNGTTTTGDDGTFKVEIPLVAEQGEHADAADFLRKTRFFNFDVEATVTDLSGESHEGEMSLPLGTKPTAFAVDLPEKIEKDSLKQMTFSYRNSSGMDILGAVKYRVDQGDWKSASSNTPICLKDVHLDLQSGKHTLEAICERDTLQQEFVVFSVADTHPATTVTDWHYQTAKVFPRDGKPVYLQVGSSENGAHIVYSIIAGNKLLEKGAWELSDSIVTLPLTYKAEYETGVTLNYSFIKEGKCYSETMMVERPLPDKRLELTWKTFRNRLTPGQKEEWTLQVKTPDGKPAKAQLLSVLYDKSLDQITKHLWDMQLGIGQWLPSSYWTNSLGSYPFSLYSNFPTKYFDQAELSVDHFDATRFLSLGIGSYGPGLDEVVVVGYGVSKQKSHTGSIRVRGTSSNMEMMAAPAPMAKRMDMAVSDMADSRSLDAGQEEKGNKSLDEVQVRENLDETAFFYPALESDNNGNVSLKFTLPESITTWKFMGLAHDKEMRNGLLTDEAVAKKTVMVQPNMPRFLREGDKAIVMVKAFNTSDKKVSGQARMQMIDPETNKVVWQKVHNYNIDANGTTTLDFDVSGIKQGIYINKVVAAGNGYSDGEQHYLPVLSNREWVTNTLPITLHEKGTTTLDLSKLFEAKDGRMSKDAKNVRVTIEYTDNPSWLMIQALPSVSNPSKDNAISLMTAIYSNTIAQSILRHSPVIKDVVSLWKQEENGKGKASSQQEETSLMSSLEKNQDLKNLVLNETPWVLEADKESAQKQQLINYFDESKIASRLNGQVKKLKALQNNDGSFSWWKNMAGSRYMTSEVAEMMVRLNRMTGVQEQTINMLTRALAYLQKQAGKEVNDMQKAEAKVKEKETSSEKLQEALNRIRPSEEALHYLYVLALDGRKLDAAASSDAQYLLKKMADRTCEFTIYGKSLAAVILGLNGYQQKAQEYLQSIDEYSVYKPEMGRYFDTHKAYYSWCDYRIPTQVAAIEAYQLLEDSTKAETRRTIEEMQRWLLQSKRTQAWDTPVNTVNAVYAFMNGNERAFDKNEEVASLKLDGKSMEMPKATAGLGYVKVSKEGVAKTLTIAKKNEGTSWGAVYAQFSQPSSEVASAASGIKVVRVVVPVNGEVGKGNLSTKVGEKVRVTLMITADRDYDFVQIVDKRAACLEPVNQLSGYQWGLGCYVSPKDHATNFYFDRLSKGSHLVEMEYYVDRKGEYQAGSCTVQCAYSPEFGGRAEGYQMQVKE